MVKCDQPYNTNPNPPSMKPG